MKLVATDKAPGGVVELSNGNANGERQFITIDKDGIELSEELAHNALRKYGPESTLSTKGWVEVECHQSDVAEEPAPAEEPE